MVCGVRVHAHTCAVEVSVTGSVLRPCSRVTQVCLRLVRQRRSAGSCVSHSGRRRAFPQPPALGTSRPRSLSSHCQGQSCGQGSVSGDTQPICKDRSVPARWSGGRKTHPPNLLHPHPDVGNHHVQDRVGHVLKRKHLRLTQGVRPALLQGGPRGLSVLPGHGCATVTPSHAASHP